MAIQRYSLADAVSLDDPSLLTCWNQQYYVLFVAVVMQFFCIEKIPKLGPYLLHMISAQDRDSSDFMLAFSLQHHIPHRTMKL